MSENGAQDGLDVLSFDPDGRNPVRVLLRPTAERVLALMHQRYPEQFSACVGEAVTGSAPKATRRSG